ncbi:MAG: efflux RND transporter permease subunit [Puniceicoccaceae bacterium]
MNLPAFSVRRPVLTTMVTMILLLLGITSLSRLQIDLLPAIELPTMTVRTDYEGASPEVMERLVTQIVEEIVSTVPGIEEITSTSSEGQSRVRVQFSWGTNVDAAALELQAALDDEVNELPRDVTRPRVSTFDPNSFPVVLLGISSELDPIEITEIVETNLRARFQRVPGVAQADIWGGFDREIRIEVDPHRLTALNLGLQQVIEALNQSNLDRPTGSIESGKFDVFLRAPGNYQNLEEIRQTKILNRNGTPVELGEFATVLDTNQRLTRIIRINQQPGIRIAIRKKPSANTVEVSRNILAEIESINRDFPQLSVVPVVNQGNFIQRSIENVGRSVLYGGGLAVLVLLFFLRSFRSTLVIGLAIPIALITTFILLYFGGLTLNIMSLGGLALGVGMMVDSSIVVLENIFRRRRREKEDATVAAARGASEVASALIASTLTTLVIFLPLAFIEGVSGILFADLALTVGISLVAALAVSLSVLPMLSSIVFKQISPTDPDSPSPETKGFFAWSERSFHALENSYSRLVERGLRHRWKVLLGASLGVASSLLLVPRIGTEFLPPSDEGEIRVSGEMEVGTRLDLVDRQTRQIEEIVFPAVSEVVASVTQVQGDSGSLQLSLVPSKDRSRSNVEIAEDLRGRLQGQIPGMTIRTRAPQGQFLIERLLGNDEGLTIEVQGFQFNVLDQLTAALSAVIAEVPGVSDVDRSIDAGTPESSLVINRARADDLGISIAEITSLLQTAIAGSRAGEFRVGGNAYRIFVQLAQAQQRSIDEVLELNLATSLGNQIPLRSLVSVQDGRSPTEIRRKEMRRIATVTANVVGRPQGDVAREIIAAIAQIPRPDDYTITVAGSYAEQQESFGQLSLSLIFALLLVYMVLASQYESLRDPLIVMFSTPTAGVGVILILYLSNTTFNLQSGIGCILLGGIAVNSAILLVDQASSLRRQPGWATFEAIVEASRRRLRPILMTTSTTILGLLPLALGIGEGAEAQAPLARAVVGGLITSTIVTLFLIPAVYSIVYRAQPPTPPA